MSNFRIALTTCPEDSSDRIARNLVESRLCACVNIVRDISSIYHWRGEIEKETEDLLIMKTTAEGTSALKKGLLAAHPYEVPEFIVLSIDSGHGTYLDWIARNVGLKTTEE